MQRALKKDCLHGAEKWAVNEALKPKTPGYRKSIDVQVLRRASPRERPPAAMATEPEAWGYRSQMMLSQTEMLDVELQGLVSLLRL